MIHPKGFSLLDQLISPTLQHLFRDFTITVFFFLLIMHSKRATALASLLKRSLHIHSVKTALQLDMIKVLLYQLSLVSSINEMIHVDFFVEGVKVFQGIEEIIKITNIAKAKYGVLKVLKQTYCNDDHANASGHYHEIPDIGKDFVGKEVDEQVAEPLEEPQVMSEVRHVENVRIKSRVHSHQCVAEDQKEGIVERKFLLIHAKKKIPLACGQTNEHFQRILLRETKDKQVSDDEVQALTVSHLWEIISDLLKNKRKLLQHLGGRLKGLKGFEGATNILLNLFPNLVIDELVIVVWLCVIIAF